jgi:two-component system, NtrC family, response regulator AtoC
MAGSSSDHDPLGEAKTLGLDDERADTAQGLSLRVFGESGYTTHVLPASGDVVIGRSAEADIRIDDPSISRRHAVLHLGPPLSIEDLGSANGTRVRESRVEANTPIEIAPGEVVDLGSVMILVQGATSLARPAETIVEEHAEAPRGDAAIVIQDPSMERIYRVIDRIAQGTISVLLLGETGVGKEILAEEVHRRSPRRERSFVRLNCGAFTESLLESELFGHEKGAFTGADRAKPGLFETADGGTVFLDEVGELPMTVQVKLLRVLEDKKVMRVGGLEPRAIDVRFVAATNRELEREVKQGRFRQDLFFRISGVSLLVPPLRERRAEIAPLARTFVAGAARQANREPPRISSEALAALEQYRWPGNIRELRNFMERAVLLAEDEILLEHLPLEKMNALPSAPARPAFEPQVKDSANLKGELDAIERQRILDALDQCAGNQTKAAQLLGISRGTLLLRLEKHGLPRPRKRNKDE